MKIQTIQSQGNSNRVGDFKLTFTTQFNTFKDNVNHLALGGALFADTWKDWAGLGSVTIGLSVMDALLTGLAACGILAIATATGVGVAVIVVGFAATAAFTLYRFHKKLNAYRSVMDLFCRDDVEQQADNLAGFLANTYKELLENCTKKEAKKLVHVCMREISNTILKKKINSLEELTDLKWSSNLITKSAKHPQRKIKPKKEKRAVNSKPEKTSVANSSIFHYEEKFSPTKSQSTTCQKFSI